VIFILSVKADELEIELHIRNREGEPIKNAFVTVWMWYPNETSRVIKIAKSGNDGLIKFSVSWRDLLGRWLGRAKTGKIESAGLIIDIYDPENNSVATKAILIDVSKGNPGKISSVLVMNNTCKLGQNATKFKNPTSEFHITGYTPIVEESHEYRGRINLAYAKTDANTIATIDYVMVAGDKTRARLFVGYTYSDYTSISEPVYQYTHNEKKESNS